MRERGSTRLHTINVFSNILLRNSTNRENVPVQTGRLLDNYLRMWLDYVPLDDSEIQASDEDISDYDGTSAETDDIMSDVQSNERLLLSSARQNPTDTNTLIPVSSGSTELSRRGAICRDGRLEPRVPSFTRTLKEEEIRRLYIDLDLTMTLIRQVQGYPGMSPLFTYHSLHRTISDRHNKRDLLSNLDSTMDDFLLESLSEKLWLSGNKPDYSQPSTPGEIVGKRKRKWPQGSSSSREKVSKKKRTTKIEESCALQSPFESVYSDALLGNLSHEQKHMIMNITFSSFLKSGSTFTLENESLSKECSSSIELVLSSVDYDTRELHGFFSLLLGSDQHKGTKSKSGLHILLAYERYFLGLVSRKEEEENDKYVAQRLKLLKKLDREIDKLKVRDEIDVGNFSIPVKGKLIDFKHNDLRFLPKIEVTNNVPRRSLHLARAKSNRVRIQFMEWMKIDPFSQFEITYFLQSLGKAKKSLETYKTQSPSEQKETTDLARGLRNDMYDITRNITFINKSNISLPLIEEQRASRNMAFTKYKRTFFIQDWEKKLTDKITKFLTCQEGCLLNIHLNYILFTMTLDIRQVLKNSFESKLRCLPDSIQKKFLLQYMKLAKCLLGDNDEVVLLCSINRKTGEIQIQNTRPYLEYKQVYLYIMYNNLRFEGFQSDDVISLHRIFGDDATNPENSGNDSEIFPNEWIEHMRTDPYNEESIDTVLKGNFKVRSSSEKSPSGGNQSFSIV